MLINAFNGNQGISSNEPDARSFFSFFVDLNFVDSSNSLLENNRRTMIRSFREELNKRDSDKTTFYHLRIQDVTPSNLRTKLVRIATDFRIEDDDAAAIKKAVDCVMVKDNTCLQKIRGLLSYRNIKIPQDSYCT